MSEGQSETQIEVYVTNIFKKALNKLSDEVLTVVEDEIDKIIADPEIGEQKKGDLSYLRVHKFKVEGFEMLLGYNWREDRLELNLLNIGVHENFYLNMKNRRKADIKFIG
mgnify:CR=1 FL=1